MTDDSVLAGVDIGGTKILGVTVHPDDPATVLDEHRVPTPVGSEAVLDAIAGVVKELARAHPHRADGVGIAGLVNLDGVLRTGPNLPTMRAVSVGAELGARLDLTRRAWWAGWGRSAARRRG